MAFNFENNPESVINGAFGALVINNTKLASIRSVDYEVGLLEQTIKIAGTRRMGYKTLGTEGTGSFRFYKVDSSFINLLPRWFILADDEIPASAINIDTMSIQLSDPESGIGVANRKESVELVGVKVNRLAGGFDIEAIVEQTINFTFLKVAKVYGFDKLGLDIASEVFVPAPL